MEYSWILHCTFHILLISNVPHDCTSDTTQLITPLLPYTINKRWQRRNSYCPCKYHPSHQTTHASSASTSLSHIGGHGQNNPEITNVRYLAQCTLHNGNSATVSPTHAQRTRFTPLNSLCTDNNRYSLHFVSRFFLTDSSQPKLITSPIIGH